MSFEICPECGSFLNEDGDDYEIMFWCDNIKKHKDKRQWKYVHKYTDEEKQKMREFNDYWYDYYDYLESPLEGRFRWI